MYWALGAAALAALIDWVSVHREDDRTEAIAKAAVMVLLIAAVVASCDRSLAMVLIGVALLFSLLGDVLLLPRFDNFLGGLAAFLLGHIFYALGFLRLGVDPAGAIAGAAVALLGILVAGRRIVAGATLQDDNLGKAVVAYTLVISAMVTLGVGVGPIVAIGATLFVASDAVLGWNRFVAPLPHGRLLIHTLYHLGQGLIVLGVLTG
ncbi:MAG: lysoplasmalogenase [Acidimicrobiales bacterium]|nr:lysoplasmalogenase [Acidimicrobiales bacterium]RZV41291.1 MAG: lysoplasmalogenase [Acidimicrobiales bacterium]